MLVILDHQHVVIVAIANRLAHLGLREHRIAGDDVATLAWRQDVEQLQRGLVFVGLGIDTELGQDGSDTRSKCRQEVNGRQLCGSVGTATNALAIHVDDEWVTGWQTGSDPVAENHFQCPDINPREEFGERGSGGQSSSWKSQEQGEVATVIVGELDDGFRRTASQENADDQQSEDGSEREGLALVISWIWNGGQRIQQAGRAHRTDSGDPPLQAKGGWATGIANPPPFHQDETFNGPAIPISRLAEAMNALGRHLRLFCFSSACLGITIPTRSAQLLPEKLKWHEMIAVVLAVLALDLRPLDLGVMSLDRARFLDNKPITVSLIVEKPAYTLLGRTIVGAADRDDDAERGAVLLGRRFDVKEGERLVVRGTLRVIYHPPCFVGNVAVAGWWEVRVEEVR